LSFFCVNYTIAQYNTEGELKQYYFDKNPDEKFQIDTGLLNFEEYNFEKQELWEYYNLGRIGTAHQSLSFNWNRRKGFKDGNVFFENYMYDISRIKRYKTTKFPYSELSYLMGSAVEQIARIVHAQNIKNRFEFALDVQGVSSNGTYRESNRTRNIALSFYGKYASKNNRYHLGVDFTYSTIKVSENGGILEDVLTDRKESKQFYTSNISNAITEQSTLSFLIHNSYDFGFNKTREIDSLKITKFTPIFRLKHSIGTNITNNSFLGKNANDSLFYGSFLQSIDSTKNTLKYHNIPNRISFEYLGTVKGDSVKYRNISAEIALQHNNIEIWHNLLEHTTNNVMLEANVSSNAFSGSKLFYNVNAHYIFTGFNQGELSAFGKLGYDFNKYGKISASLLAESIKPTWIEKHYNSSSKKWNNNHFIDKHIVATNISYSLAKYKLKFEANLKFLENYIFFDKSATPVQTNAKITYWNFSIKKDTKWKIWHWNNFIGIQSTNHQEILPLPLLFIKTSLFAEFRTFKKNLLLSTGIDLRYNTSFYARAWNPVVSQFHLQEERKMSFTPVIDLFINAQIKTVRIYIKANYINEGLFVANNYKALNYPSNGRTFSFGMSWRFFE